MGYKARNTEKRVDKISTMTREEVRKLILRALYGDPWLFGQLVLKGGNALSLVYNVGGRTSLDLDFSLKDDFDDIAEVSMRMESALSSTFTEVAIRVFDFRLEPKPRSDNATWWGGYIAEFKLIPRSLAEKLSYKIEDMRRQALTIDPGSQRRRYVIEISKFEFVSDKEVRKVDDFEVCVYSPLLLAAEKLRALLQQHPDYPQINERLKRSRARDLYDIWAISDFFSIKLDMHLETVRAVFDAKKVDLSLLGRLSELRALHMASWPDVELSVASPLESFDFYFNFVRSSATSLYAQWKKDSP
jgi:predicted nucleotidyltransferase component of viral defense system